MNHYKMITKKLVCVALALSLWAFIPSKAMHAASGVDWAYGTIGGEMFGAEIRMSDTINTAATYSQNNVGGATYTVSAVVYYYYEKAPNEILTMADSRVSSMNAGVTLSLPKTPLGARAMRMEGFHKVNYISKMWSTTTIVD